ncbi:unnamed protein product, partial [Ixodes pacificus]
KKIRLPPAKRNLPFPGEHSTHALLRIKPWPQSRLAGSDLEYRPTEDHNREPETQCTAALGRRSRVVQGPDHTPRLGLRLFKKARCTGTRCFTEAWTPAAPEATSFRAQITHRGLDPGCSTSSSSWFPE